MLVGQVFLPYNLSVGLAPASSPSRGASGETVHFAGNANGSPFGGAGAKRLRGQARRERTAHAAISRLFVRAMLSPRPRITVSILALSVTFGDTSPKGRGFAKPVGFALSCNQTVAFFTLFSKIKGKLKNVLLKKWRICVTLHPSCNGIFGDSGVFSPVFYGSGGRRQSDYYAFFLLFCPFWLFSGHLALWQEGKYGKM